jgi:hypothetical protein
MSTRPLFGIATTEPHSPTSSGELLEFLYVDNQLFNSFLLQTVQ